MNNYDLLQLVYEIQGSADPNHPDTLESLKERMKEIWEKACEIMERTGFENHVSGLPQG
jgi:hypothetical protein